MIGKLYRKTPPATSKSTNHIFPLNHERRSPKPAAAGALEAGDGDNQAGKFIWLSSVLVNTSSCESRPCWEPSSDHRLAELVKTRRGCGAIANAS